MSTSTPVRRHRSRAWFAAAAAVPIALAGCGNEDELPTQDDVPTVEGGAVGPNEQVDSDVEVVGVHLEFPVDGQYEVGEDASLFFAITNTGTDPVTLVDVTGEDFADAVSSGGEAAGEDALAIEVPPNANVYVGAEGSPSVTLLELTESLRSSQSIPVTLVFEDAREITVEAMVAAPGDEPSETYSFPDPDEDLDND
ncbi:copper chaperone PCu(A)C [Modestobacter roseus]|uniref:Uncharacterized protein DUF461 n=1 Tax=Modestobacter roseus TaxID=1181884 RepID=A0A562IWB2_9ACTN|nr:copper chaperone PCu(A)C [Modestobacter roseus]MQA34733.1 copper chaperone PCu(A)C [Modestobacter roseus]TWH75103.1 uncharacterized protein DUF461 [Modestobacter roseus]